MCDPPPAILPSVLDELTTIGVLLMVMLPPPLALKADLAVGSRTRMPKSPADGLPTDTARARTGTVPVPKTELNPRTCFHSTTTSVYDRAPMWSPVVGGMRTATVLVVVSLVYPFLLAA